MANPFPTESTAYQQWQDYWKLYQINHMGVAGNDNFNALKLKVLSQFLSEFSLDKNQLLVESINELQAVASNY